MKKSAKSAEESGKESVEKMRIIDADALECDTEWSEYHDGFISYSQMEIDTAPTIDAVEVVHGEWIDEADKHAASFGIHDYKCSNCNSYADEYIGGYEWYTMYKPNYCPNCGAKMDGEREGEMPLPKPYRERSK